MIRVAKDRLFDQIFIKDFLYGILSILSATQNRVADSEQKLTVFII
jgi:hypothetical protein